VTTFYVLWQNHVICIPPTTVNPLVNKLSEQTVIEPHSGCRRGILLYNCSGFQNFYNQVNRNISGINESMPYRQDHEQVISVTDVRSSTRMFA
jgi:hypothetical protein